MPWSKIAKFVITLGIGWAIDKYAKKRVPKSLTQLLEDASKTGVVPPELQKAVEVLGRAQLDDAMAELLRSSKKLGETLDKAGIGDGPPPVPRRGI